MTVGKADATGHCVVARANVAELPPASVRLRGNRLLWQQGGRSRSLRLR